jgi:hypothetical protein
VPWHRLTAASENFYKYILIDRAYSYPRHRHLLYAV